MNDVKELVPDMDVKMEITTVLTRPMVELIESDGVHSLHVDVIYKQFLRKLDGELEEIAAPLAQSLMALAHGVVSVLRSMHEEAQTLEGGESLPDEALPQLGQAFCGLLMGQLVDAVTDEEIVEAEAADGFDLPDDVKTRMQSTAHLWNKKKM